MPIPLPGSPPPVSTLALGLASLLLVGAASPAAAAPSAVESAGSVSSEARLTEVKARPAKRTTKSTTRRSETRKQKRASSKAEPDESPGVLDTINQYYPIILDDDLEPEVQEKVVPLWLTSACCGQVCGSLWIPVLVVGEDPGAEYFIKEALIAILLETVTNLLGGATTAFAGIGSILILANLLYLTPVNIINTYDRALKRERSKTKEAALGGLPRRRTAVAMAF